MSKSRPTIWMNVTTSTNWQRPPVGIVRVEQLLCNELKKFYNTQFKVCIWNGERFIEQRQSVLASTYVEAKIQNTHSATPVVKVDLPLIFPILPRSQALRNLGQSVLSLIPYRLRPYFNRFLYYIRPRVVRMISNSRIQKFISHLRGYFSKRPDAITFSSAVDFSSKQSNAHPSAEIFKSGDVLISLGADWHYSYYKEFYSLRKKSGIKVVTCCYDIIPIIYPQYCLPDVSSLFSSYFLDVADGSDLILCISKQSEKDLNSMLDRTGGARPLTHVFSLGDNIPSATSELISPQVSTVCQAPFILFVSTIERRKNHEVLYRAYHILCSQGKHSLLPKLVFVGMQGWGVDELMKDLELDPLTYGMIIRLTDVSDTELRTLYEASLFCVFPSHYEGWGLPVGEALSLGKAVLCSNGGSLPEVGGDAVLYIDPWSPTIWAEEIYRMSTDSDWRMQWERKAKNQYKTRSWITSAYEVKSFIDDIL